MIPPVRQRLLVDVFTGLVIVSVGVALAGLTWRLAGFAGTAAPAIVAAAPSPAGPVDVGPAIALAPFGRPTADGLPPTTLPLELRAIFLAVPASASTAMIAPPGGKPLSYGLGAAVSGATIAAIDRDRVVLETGGRRELLAFPKATAPAASAPTGPAIGPSDRPPSAGPIVAAPPPASPGFVTTLGATPTAEGYRIGTPPSAAALAAGLQPGDLIATVNGSPVGDPAQDARTFAMAGNAAAARVEIVRGGRRITLSLPVR